MTERPNHSLRICRVERVRQEQLDKTRRMAEVQLCGPCDVPVPPA